MTAHRTNLPPFPPTMITWALLLVFLVGGMSAPSVLAQDYKEAYNAALEAAGAKNYTLAYQKYEEAARGARSAGDQDVVNSSNKVLSQLDRINGTRALKQGNFEVARGHFEKGIAHNPSYAPNYHNLGLALKNLDDLDGAIDAWKNAIEKGNASRTSKGRETARAAEKALRENLYYAASSRLGKSNPSRADADAAITTLDASTAHIEPDADYYYYMAVARNVRGEYTQSIAMADKALDIHRGSRTDKAKIHFIKGEALMYQGDIDGAKASFANAAYGSYKASAEHYLQTL
ncbi:MAG: hypothetical protein ACE5G0_07655 [Rhodothermales bacterium]